MTGVLHTARISTVEVITFHIKQTYFKTIASGYRDFMDAIYFGLENEKDRVPH